MFLATTALEEFWDKDQEIIFLGPWCMKDDKRSGWSQLNYRVLPSPWDNRSTRDEAFQYLKGCTDRMLSRLSNYLNQVHNTSHSERYWRILIGSWLLHYVHVVYDRHLHLKKALQQYPKFETVVLNPNYYLVPKDSGSFVSSIYYDPCNLQIFSQLLVSMGYKFPEYGPLPAVKGHQNDFRSKAVRKYTRARNQLDSRLERFWEPKAAILLSGLCCERDVLMELKKALQARIAIQDVPLRSPEPIFDRQRTKLTCLEYSDDFEKCLVQLLSYHFPALYLEGYSEVRTLVLKKNPHIPPVLASAVDWYSNEPFKFLAAEAAESKHRLVAIQHGGGYGSLLSHPTETFERQIADTFISWGWADLGRDIGCRNMPSQKLATRLFPLRVQEVQKTTHPRILFLSANHARYLHRIHSIPLAGQWDDYFLWQARFFRSLPNNLYRNIRFRPYPEEYDRDTKQRIFEISPDIQVEPIKYRFKKNYLYERLKNCSLVIVDHCDTASLEVLAANIPTILFWDPERWLLRPEAAPYYDDLRRVGILHDTPEAAASKVAAVHDRPQIWWQTPELQAVRTRFVNHFAWRSDNWVNEWARLDTPEFFQVPKNTEGRTDEKVFTTV